MVIYLHAHYAFSSKLFQLISAQIESNFNTKLFVLHPNYAELTILYWNSIRISFTNHMTFETRAFDILRSIGC